MKLSVSREVKLLSLSFFLIFFGFNGVQQYVTTFFSEAELVNVGFQSLILVYLFFTLFDPVSAIFVSKYGPKKSMIIASIFYSIYIFSLLSKSIIFIYFTSSLLGIAASLLWTGNNCYLIMSSDKKSYGSNAGFFSSFQSLGSSIGAFVLGFIILNFYFNSSFLLFGIFPLIGFLLLFKLRDLRGKQKVDHLRLVKKSITSITALRLSVIWFSFMFVYGLVIGIIPIEIKNILGVSYVGYLSSLFFIIPIFLSYFFGRFSDIKGRKGMIIFSFIVGILGLGSLYFTGGPFLLILGIFLLALNNAITRTMTYALIGDVTTKNNIEFLTALFWMITNVGVVSALVISRVIQTKMIYIISIATMIFSLMIILPLFRLKLKEIKDKISKEME
jgi:MFS family permease